GPRGHRVQGVGRVGQSGQDAGIHQVRHYSYRPSLLTASLERDTPQSVAAASRPRSHSSRGWTLGGGARKRSRKALRARTSGATPFLWASSLKAAASSGVRVITIAAPPFWLPSPGHITRLGRKNQGPNACGGASFAGPPKAVRLRASPQRI